MIYPVAVVISASPATLLATPSPLKPVRDDFEANNALPPASSRMAYVPSTPDVLLTPEFVSRDISNDERSPASHRSYSQQFEANWNSGFPSAASWMSYVPSTPDSSSFDFSNDKRIVMGHSKMNSAEVPLVPPWMSYAPSTPDVPSTPDYTNRDFINDLQSLTSDDDSSRVPGILQSIIIISACTLAMMHTVSVFLFIFGPS